MAASSLANGQVSTKVKLGKPTNPMVTALLCDMYQFTMAYAYWKADKHLDRAVFDLLHRKNPFRGEYTIFAGLEECIRFAANFHFEESEIDYLRTIMPPTCEDAFFHYLQSVDCSNVEIYAIPEGSVVFPRIPLIRVEGPLLTAQLLETAFLNLVNYASLVTTNAARHRQVAGSDKLLVEFGLRRAQGPDGGISASKYCYLGGFDATSNVDAGKRFGIPVLGTHSHAFVSSFMGLEEITERSLVYSNEDAKCDDFVGLTQRWLCKLQAAEPLRDFFAETNQSELAAFTSYALSFPTRFQALVDTFDAEERLLCRHPFSESKRAYVIPQRVEKLYKCYWAGNSGVLEEQLPSLQEVKTRCQEQLAAMRPDHLRGLNPTPYKVSVTAKLYEFIHFLWLSEAPVGELR